MQLVVDLNTIVVPANRRVWRAFPGRAYHLLPIFVNQYILGFEFPDLQFPEGRLELRMPHFREILSASIALRDWYRKGREGQRPSTELEAYAGRHWNPALITHRGTFVGLFGEAAEGDLVIVPDRLSERRVWIAEFATGPDDRARFQLERYPGATFVGRKVKNVREINELLVPSEVSSLLRTQNYFTLLPREFYKSTFDAYYETYTTEEKYVATLRTSSPDFTQRDEFDLSSLALLAAGLWQAVEDDVWPSGTISVDILIQTLRPEYDATLGLHINSPGTIKYELATMVPLFLAAFLGVLEHPLAFAQDAMPQVKVINTKSPGEQDRCTLRIQIGLETSLQQLGFIILQRECRRMARLKDSTKLNTGTIVREKPTQPAREQ